MLEKIHQAVSYIRHNTSITPDVGIVLGTGLGALVHKMDIQNELPYETIPNFPVSTVDGHHGKLIFGHLGKKSVVVMQGRFHYYEGYSMNDLIFPIRVMKIMGIKYLFLSNASGGVNPDFEVGDIMIIEDHINLLPNPLVGPNLDDLGPRFPDMSEAYSKNLVEKAEHIAKQHDIKIKKGVYTATSGPTFETIAEYKYFRTIGSDTVGMSTTPEVIAANHMGIPCFAMSVITDLGVPGKIEKVTHEEVLRVATRAEDNMSKMFRLLIESI